MCIRDRYKGEWENGLRHGQGTQKLPGGGTYSGGWRKNQYHGTGRLSQHDGLEYDGEWCEHQRHGYGTQKYAKTGNSYSCLLYTSPSPRDRTRSRMPSSA
eukprot:TRINITY_DN28110_c0_g1_i1.p2 TRINITY_DN28110_c0_g1~~TRINITY_DN28110_c0_g1_i1.p2  ORF type:complete len:100 (-),score=36.93 TRINITY_DN28110_c0_g1_i1:77-376(-)